MMNTAQLVTFIADLTLATCSAAEVVDDCVLFHCDEDLGVSIDLKNRTATFVYAGEQPLDDAYFELLVEQVEEILTKYGFNRRPDNSL